MMMTNHILHTDQHQHQQIQSPQSIADYLAQLLKDRKQLAALPNVFTHLERLLDEGESTSSICDPLMIFWMIQTAKMKQEDLVRVKNEWSV